MYRIKKIHFVGIGGTGMCGVAEVLLNQGYFISGSDKAENAAITRLRGLGAKIFLEHKRSNVDAVDAVVISSAIASENPEVIAAKEARIPILPRAQMLAELMRLHHGIAVSGTHGKTTTTSLIASLLAEGGLDPTFVIGGLLNSVGTNAKKGLSKYFVAEADESDASFLRLHPTIAVVTNIEADHMLTYGNDFNKLRQAFIDFLHNLPFYGLATVCIDDPTIKNMTSEISRPQITYGFDPSADISASDFRQDGMVSKYTVRFKDSGKSINVKLNLAGRHNVLNSLAAIAVARECEIGEDAILRALENFKGVGRRLECYGELDMPCGKVKVFDDYGHHPSEIAVTLESLRDAYPGRRIVLAFQPHRYTRTQDLFDDFAIALSETDVLLLLEIYAASEEPIPGVHSSALARNIRQRGKVDPIYVKTAEDLLSVFDNVLQDGDVLLLQGAGSIGTVASNMKNFYKAT